MKKHVIILVLILSLLLAGCGGSTPKEPEELTFYPAERITTYSDGDSHRDTYEYDKNWNLTLGITYRNGEEVSRVQYKNTKDSTQMTFLQDGEESTMELRLTHDEQGNETRVERYSDGELTLITECTFDEKGNRLTQTDTRVATNDVSRHEMAYDENGNMTKMTLDGGSTTVYTYDDQGRLVKQEQLSAEGQQGNYYEYTYSTDGLTRTCLYYQSNGFPGGKTIETYDAFGNMLRSERYDGVELTETTLYSYIGTDGTISSGIESEG